MKFNFTENTRTVAEINRLFRDGELFVDHSYQRRAIWSESDKIKLIETILLNYVIPSVYLWQSKIDPETGESKTHIVDGQQRLTALSEFISGKFKLSDKHLLDDRCKEKYDNKYFADLVDDDKTKIWNYKISVIEIDKDAEEDDVINMFNRLNLTEYTLNAQEKRHAQRGCFHEFAVELSNNKFWSDLKIFSANDVKRMNDVTYCANIIILAKRGIIDQSKIHQPINEAYEKYKDEYPELNDDMEKVEKAINYFYEVNEFTTHNKPNVFFKKKVQNYSIFSLIFYMIRKNITWDNDSLARMENFIKIYENIKNINVDSLNLTEKEKNLFDYFRRYKLASSEGVNKLQNRTIRFSILKNLIFGGASSPLNDQELIESLRIKIKESK